jgi:hypothetical protein
MKFIVRTSLLLLLICLFVLPTPAQKRAVKAKASSTSSPKTLCQGDAVPKGYVVVAATRTSKCVELTVKKPTATELVCDGSPVPEGYSVMKQDASPRCRAANAIPLNNAMVISNDGSTVTPPVRQSARRNDDEEDERPRPTIRVTINGKDQDERPKSVVEQRADEEQRKARIANAALNHQIQL